MFSIVLHKEIQAHNGNLVCHWSYCFITWFICCLVDFSIIYLYCNNNLNMILWELNKHSNTLCIIVGIISYYYMNQLFINGCIIIIFHPFSISWAFVHLFLLYVCLCWVFIYYYYIYIFGKVVHGVGARELMESVTSFPFVDRRDLIQFISLGTKYFTYWTILPALAGWVLFCFVLNNN